MPDDPSALFDAFEASATNRQGEFATLLGFLWSEFDSWSQAADNWDDLLTWANGQYGTYDDYTGSGSNLGMAALDTAMDSKDRSSVDKFQLLKSTLQHMYADDEGTSGQIAVEPEEDKEGSRADQLDAEGVTTLGELVKTDPAFAAYVEYDPAWQHAYDPINQVHLWRPDPAAPWSETLPEHAKSGGDRYTDIKEYGTGSGWWYGMDTMATESVSEEKWRFTYTGSSTAPSGQEGGPHTWLTNAEYQDQQAPVSSAQPVESNLRSATKPDLGEEGEPGEWQKAIAESYLSLKSAAEEMLKLEAGLAEDVD